jgi:hypothetical protein
LGDKKLIDGFQHGCPTFFGQFKLHYVLTSHGLTRGGSQMARRAQLIWGSVPAFAGAVAFEGVGAIPFTFSACHIAFIGPA